MDHRAILSNAQVSLEALISDTESKLKSLNLKCPKCGSLLSVCVYVDHWDILAEGSCLKHGRLTIHKDGID